MKNHAHLKPRARRGLGAVAPMHMELQAVDDIVNKRWIRGLLVIVVGFAR